MLFSVMCASVESSYGKKRDNDHHSVRPIDVDRTVAKEPVEECELMVA